MFDFFHIFGIISVSIVKYRKKRDYGMLNSLCAAAVNPSDITVLVVLVIGLIAGIVAGFAKMLNGTLGGLIAIVAAVCLGFFLSGMLASRVPAFVGLQDKITTFFSSKFDVCAYNAKVADGELLINVSGDRWTSVSVLFDGSSKLKIALLVQTVCVKLFSGVLTGSISLATLAGLLVVRGLCALIIFIVSIIVLSILFSVISSILSKIAEKQKSFRALDRIFGLIFSVALTVALIFVVMFAIAKIGPSAQVAIDNIEAGTVAKWFYENNPFLLL